MGRFNPMITKGELSEYHRVGKHQNINVSLGNWWMLRIRKLRISIKRHYQAAFRGQQTEQRSALESSAKHSQ